MILKNSCKMGAWFLMADVRHLCLDKGYDHPCVNEEVYVMLMDLRSISAAEGKKHGNSTGILFAAG